MSPGRHHPNPMAKRQHEEPDTDLVGADLPAEEQFVLPAEEPQTVVVPFRRYVGPAYDKGIELGGTRTLIRPAEYTAAEIDAFLLRHPEKASWWTLQ